MLKEVCMTGKISRRGFLKWTGASIAGAALGQGIKLESAHAQMPFKYKRTKETTTICPYCAVGCGIIVHSRDGKFIGSEGDPDHPINNGKLCPKGKSLTQLSYDFNKSRLTKPLYRAPKSKQWKEVSWAWALNRIAKRVKESRDKHFIKTNAKGQIVNRVEAIASVGSAALDNEECYIYQKFLRGLGLVYIEHQARI
jgi:formate dehydrogenase major subunit